MKKDKIVLIVLIIAVIAIIVFIKFYKNPITNNNQETMQCIANNSLLIVSKTCGHCANQKEILGKHLDLFEVIYLEDNPEIRDVYPITGIPSWVIDGKIYSGVQSVEKLKELTNC